MNTMINKELIKNHIKEKNKQGFTNKKFDTFFDGRVFQICFYSKGCRFSKTGNCIMCDYGSSRKENLKPNDIKEIMQKVFDNFEEQPQVLLLNSLGSILDEIEMPKENLIVLLDEISKINIDVIIFETHYTSISNEILQLIKEKLPKKQIVIELGFETSNSKYRKNYLNKIINNEKFIEKVNLIKSFGFDAEANILFGIPFLSIDKQIKDCINSIKWCFNNNIDKVNLFPINIKPYTLLYKLYENGQYSPVRHKDFIEVIKKIPKEYLNKIHLCWYGNRELQYNKVKTILPECKKNEYHKIMEFYKKFNMNKNKEYRIKLLSNFEIK